MHRRSLTFENCYFLLKESYKLVESFKNFLTSYQLQQITRKTLTILSEKINNKEEINNYKIHKLAMIIIKHFFYIIYIKNK